MTSRTAKFQQVVRWTFTRGTDVITCAVHTLPSAFRVSLIPHGPRKTGPGAIGRGQVSTVQSCASLSAALRQHADIAAALRDQGWTVASYTNSPLTPDSRPAAVAHAA
jgi:hypothetical protein